MSPFLSTQLRSGAPYDQNVVATDKMIVLNQDIYLNVMMPCNIEQADERFLLHIFDASKSFDWILIKTVDNHIAIITTVAFWKFPSIKELWIELGKGKSVKCIPIYEIALH